MFLVKLNFTFSFHHTHSLNHYLIVRMKELEHRLTTFSLRMTFRHIMALKYINYITLHFENWFKQAEMYLSRQHCAISQRSSVVHWILWLRHHVVRRWLSARCCSYLELIFFYCTSVQLISVCLSTSTMDNKHCDTWSLWVLSWCLHVSRGRA